MKKFTQRFLRDNRAVTAIEYGLIAGLVVLVIVASVTSIGTNLKTALGNVAAAIPTGASAGG